MILLKLNLLDSNDDPMGEWVLRADQFEGARTAFVRKAGYQPQEFGCIVRTKSGAEHRVRQSVSEVLDFLKEAYLP